MTKLIESRWGINPQKFSCRISTIKGIRVAKCKLGEEKIIGHGKGTKEALQAVFKKIK